MNGGGKEEGRAKGCQTFKSSLRVRSLGDDFQRLQRNLLGTTPLQGQLGPSNPDGR